MYEITSERGLLCSKTLVNTAKSPHTLIAGTTGAGKSVALNSILYSLMFSSLGRAENYFVMIDTKRVELKPYAKCVKTLAYETEPERVPSLLDGVIDIMEDRYAEMEGRETDGYHIYVVVDELADLIDEPGVLKRLVKLGRLGRAAHIHLICCTQDPSRHTLSAQLMQNFTTRIALKCKDQIESRQVLGHPGAELLVKHGPAIISDGDGERKFKFTLIPDEEILELIQATNDHAVWSRQQSSENPITFAPDLQKDNGETAWVPVGV